MSTLSNCYIPLPLYKDTADINDNNNDRNNDGDKTKTAKSTSLRPLHIATKVLSQSAGSCLLEIGYTKILVSVHGPRSPSASSSSGGASTSSSDKSASLLNHSQGSLQCHVRYAPTFGKQFTTSSLTHPRPLDLSKNTQILQSMTASNSNNASNEEMELSVRLHDALISSIILQQFPKCVVDVHVMILQSDGSIFSSLVVASSLALADAAIECQDLVTACTVAVLEQPQSSTSTSTSSSYSCIADPTEQEILHAKGVVTLAMLANSRQVTYWDVEGRLPSATVQNALDIGKQGCHTIHKFMRDCLIRSAIM